MGAGAIGEDNYGLNLSADDDADQESENEDCSLPELSMDQLLGSSGSLGSLRCFLGRRRLEPLPEEDSPGSGKHQVGWWWQRFQTTSKSSVGANAEERDRVFVKLNQEDEEFRRKIVDLHRKLSDVDADVSYAETAGLPNSRSSREAERLKELEAVARRAEETNSRNAEEMNAERRREAMRREDSAEASDRRKYRSRRQADQLRRSRRFEEEYDDQNGSPSSETNFLNRLRLKRRSMKLLSFLSGKAADRSQEERAARLLRMYMPEKGGARSTQNTISIHHTSRDRRFWKLRNRRRTSSA